MVTGVGDHVCGSTSFTAWLADDVEQTVWDRFEAVVQAHEDCIALVDGDDRLTYRELERRAAAVSGALLRNRVTGGAPVAVLADQGASAIASMLGILRSGAPFAPLDVLDPPSRSRALMEVAGARAIVTTAERREAAERVAAPCSWTVVDVDALPAPGSGSPTSVKADAAASVFFTSGSTGVPKAVLDVHRNILHNTLRYTNQLRIAPDDRLSVIQRIAFSGIASSVFGALLNGATLCTFALSAESLGALAEWVRSSRVTIFHSVPAIFRALTAAGDPFPHVRAVRLEGDRATWDDVARFRRSFAPEAILANGLGTTETGLVCQFQVSADTPDGVGVLPVGTAVPGVEVVAVDDGRIQVPAGEIGELAVRSSFLAREYLGAPALTAERFPTSADGHDRLYLTGDLGRIDDRGSVTCLGRRDGGLKVGGIRVAPAEVEAAILALAEVADARVRIDPSPRGGGALAAVVVPAEPGTTSDDVRRALATALPPYMIPAHVDVLPALPLDDNWKLRVPDPLERAGRTELEGQLSAIWEEVLQTEVGVSDTFVSLGGDSLAAAEIAALVERRLGRELSDRVLARAFTVARLAAELETAEQLDAVRLVTLRAGGEAMPLILLPDHKGNPLMFAELARSLEASRDVVGVELSPGADDDHTVTAVARRISSLIAERQRGRPCAIGGYCYGALLAFEVTRRLRDEGIDVRPVLLGLQPSDFPALVTRASLARWRKRFGTRFLSGARVRYHARHALARPPRAALAYLAETAGRVSGRLVARFRPTAAERLQMAARGFRPEPLHGTAHLILTSTTVAMYADQPAAAWAGLADQVEVSLIDGALVDHELLRSPAASLLARALDGLLADDRAPQTDGVLPHSNHF